MPQQGLVRQQNAPLSLPMQRFAASLSPTFPMPSTLGTTTWSSLVPGQRTGTSRFFQNQTYWVPFVIGRPHQIKRLAIEVTTAVASSTVQVGIFSANPLTTFPLRLMQDLGTVDSSSTGVKAIEWRGVEPGVPHYVGMWASDNGVFARSMSGGTWVHNAHQTDNASRFVLASRESQWWPDATAIFRGQVESLQGYAFGGGLFWAGVQE